MGVRWPPLFWADLSLKRVNRHQTFLWSQPASYHIGQSKMWNSNINGTLHRLHCICSHFISSSLCGENVIPRLQFAGIISYYIAPTVGIFTPFVNKNRVKKTDYIVKKKNNRTHSSNIRNVFPLLSGLCASWEKRNIHAGYHLQPSIFRKLAEASHGITIRIIWQKYRFSLQILQVSNNNGTGCLDFFLTFFLQLFFSASGADVCNYFMFLIQLFFLQSVMSPWKGISWLRSLVTQFGLKFVCSLCLPCGSEISSCVAKHQNNLAATILDPCSN